MLWAISQAQDLRDLSGKVTRLSLRTDNLLADKLILPFQREAA